jgi:hypothetical protein
MLGKIISPEQSTKMNDFVTGVANKKRRLHSSQQLPDFESSIEDVDKLLRRCGR